MVNLRHKIPKTAKNQQEHNWGGGGGKEVLGACDPPCPLCKPFFKQTTYNIQVAKTGEYPLFDTVWPPPLWKILALLLIKDSEVLVNIFLFAGKGNKSWGGKITDQIFRIKRSF